MAIEGVIDSKITLSDILVKDVALYKDFAGSVCGFVFNVWGGLKYINGISLELIQYLGDNFTTCKILNNKIDFASESTYGITSEWSIPKDNQPTRYDDYANYIGSFTQNGVDKIVVYGFFDDDGKLMQVKGSLSDGITFYYENENWIYTDVTIDPDTEEVITVERTTTFPMLSGCRIDALPSRNDCSDIVVQKYFDFTAINSQAILGDIPFAFLGSGIWYWDSPGVWPRIIQ